MKKPIISTLLLFQTLFLFAQTDFQGGDLTQAANWDPAELPTTGNGYDTATRGTIDTSGDWGSSGAGNVLDNYFITQTSGTITEQHGLSGRLRAGEWTINGGSLNTGVNSTQDTEVDNGQIVTVNTGGTFDTGSSRLEIRNGTVTLNGGTINANRLTVSSGAFVMNSGIVNIGGGGQFGTADTALGSITINGGTVNNAGQFGSIFNGSYGSVFLNGGTVNADTLNFRYTASSFFVELGGTTAGSFTAANGWGNITGGVDIRWNSGSLMAMTLTGETDWAETQWNAGAMTFDGQDFNTLGDWDTVNGSLFEYDSLTQTLTVIPEPSSIALIGLAALAVVVSRRRR